MFDARLCLLILSEGPRLALLKIDGRLLCAAWEVISCSEVALDSVAFRVTILDKLVCLALKDSLVVDFRPRPVLNEKLLYAIVNIFKRL